MSAQAARDEVHQLVRQFEEEPDHARHVAALALQLFDSLADLHALGPRERLLLESAACLHDIGWRTAPDGKEHHKESARLILAHPWQHFTPEEAALVAQIARYHRKKTPGPDHPDFAHLSPENRLIVQHLAALLRIADGLDRSHRAAVHTVRTEILPERIVFHLAAHSNVQREIQGALLKSDLATVIFHREIEFELEPRSMEADAG